MASYLLFENASGYALFEALEQEEIGSLLQNVQASMLDFQKFSGSVKLTAFQPFTSAENALQNMNAISEQMVTSDLLNFLEMNLPKAKKSKKKSYTLGVIEPGLGSTIQDSTDIPCKSDDTVKELIRGIRLHFSKFVKELDSGMGEKAQRGLGHSYSRSKVKMNPARTDNMVIQSIGLLDQMDKDVNSMSMRVKEWYCWHFPELKDIVKENYMFAKCAAFIGDRHSLTGDKLEELTKITNDEEMAQNIIQSSKVSMGMDSSPMDMINVVTFTQRIVKLTEYRQKLYNYLVDKMGTVAPNLATLIGETVAARLISKAGSLTSLAKCPASTVQILGAEKALFRAIKTKSNTPKYGLIYHSTFIGRAGSKNKGRISRSLANKCSLASRIDSFIDEPTTKFGEALRDQMEERLKFFESGVAPRKNVDVMMGVSNEIRKNKSTAVAKEEELTLEPKKEKSAKKKKKVKTEAVAAALEDESETKPLKEKRKRKGSSVENSDAMEIDEKKAK
eukprot:CAMPEP_0171460198 /NCGR_PEP_ID=MMETSP0945-20130129/5160_1 /TAXON_ID=109269 /ORGANISM="Vaucheria litorea, Strain CCMP2940" /LENGTH=504 /DNA_ID=CAMNT_0011986333 /DNA_START=86 /DNA_END=1597 /DNA_ORIENTATION=-